MPIIMCGANVIILDKENRVLMHHRRDNDSWGLPGGAMELGEKLEETAIREAVEEVGLRCSNLKLFNVYSGTELSYKYPDGNEVYNVTVTYVCRDFSGRIEVDKGEGRDAKFFSISEIPQNTSPPVRIIVEDFVAKYDEIIPKAWLGLPANRDDEESQ